MYIHVTIRDNSCMIMKHYLSLRHGEEDMLKMQERLSTKFVKHIEDEIFELRAEHGGNIFRVFFIFDEGNIVLLFNGFQKKLQKTPRNEIEPAKQIKIEYYAEKGK